MRSGIYLIPNQVSRLNPAKTSLPNVLGDTGYNQQHSHRRMPWRKAVTLYSATPRQIARECVAPTGPVDIELWPVASKNYLSHLLFSLSQYGSGGGNLPLGLPRSGYVPGTIHIFHKGARKSYNGISCAAMVGEQLLLGTGKPSLSRNRNLLMTAPGSGLLLIRQLCCWPLSPWRGVVGKSYRKARCLR